MSIRERVREGTGFLSGLRRYPKSGWVAGVCAGLGAYFEWNVKLLRVLFLLGLIVSGFFPVGVIYLLLWYLMDPDEATQPAYAPRTSTSDAPRADVYAPATGGNSDVRARFARLEQRLRGMEECVASKDFELRRELKKLES
jgi:phage shock protein C